MQIEWRKLKNEMRKKKDSSFMNTTLASELSKSLNEFEVSMLSDSVMSISSCGDASKTKVRLCLSMAVAQVVMRDVLKYATGVTERDWVE